MRSMADTIKRLSILWVALICLVGAGPPKVPDCGIEFEKGKDTLLVRALAPAGYHFNRKAPTELSIPAKSTKFKPSRIENGKMEFLVPGNEAFPTVTRFEAHFYICDDAESICIPQRLEFVWKGTKKAEVSTAVPQTIDRVATGKNAEGFLLNDAAGAFSTAGREHKPLMIAFTTIWCPYCNQLEEEFFPSPEFQSIAKDFVLLRMDGDAQASWELESRYGIDGYPTVVWTTSAGDEISRFVGADSARLPSLMRKARKNGNVSFAEFKRLADKGDAAIAQSVGETLLDREAYAEAEKYLQKASEQFGPKSTAAESLLRARVAQAAEKEGKKAE